MFEILYLPEAIIVQWSRKQTRKECEDIIQNRLIRYSEDVEGNIWVSCLNKEMHYNVPDRIPEHLLEVIEVNENDL